MDTTPVIKFSEESLTVLNFALGFIMFGIALGIERRDFRQVLFAPKSVITGVVSQFVLLPLITFLLILILKPSEGLAMGMILVAACPGGNVSNYITYLSKGNIALSITLTSIATIFALVMTPFNFFLYSEMYLAKLEHVNAFSLSVWQMIKSILTLILIPLILGMTLKNYFPRFIKRMERPVKVISMIIFFGFVAIALIANHKVFYAAAALIFWFILLQNGIAFLTGFIAAKLMRLPVADTKTIAIETGIQNSGLALVLIFNYFSGNAEMALIAAGWGVWHIASGYVFSLAAKRF